MCGIAGIYEPDQKSPSSNLDVLKKMLGTLVHRGPNGEGVWTDEPAGLTLGHRRLAVIDLTDQAAQPMSSRCGRYTVSFNGEIYNFAALGQALRDKGYTPQGSSDTAVLIESFSAYGVERALKSFNGMFALAVWDHHRNTLTIARDRLGKKPLYYGFAGRAFIFASELTALTKHPQFDRSLDSNSLTQYLKLNYIPAPRSIYSGYRKLLPGQMMTLNASRIRAHQHSDTHHYWRPETALTPKADAFNDRNLEDYTSTLETLLLDSVKLRMHADVATGSFLSGGIDSTLITALMQSQSPTPIDSYTLRFDEDGYDDAEHAAMLAKRLGTRHHECHVTEQDALDSVSEMSAIYDEPFSDSSQIPTTLISRMASKQITVALTGDGGDELFFGYDRYFRTLRISRINRLIPTSMRRMIGSFWKSPNRPQGSRFRTDLVSQNDLELYHNRISKFAQPELLLLHRSLQLETRIDLVFQNDPTLRTLGLADKMMLHDQLQYLPDDILVKVDRASMASSLEVRNPLLDPRVVEFASRLPLTFKHSPRHGKLILKSLLGRYVPESVYNIPKRGFGSPIKHWIKGSLKEWALELLDPIKLRDQGIFDPDAVARLWTEFANGQKNHTHLWSILMFLSWHELHEPHH